MGYFSFSSVLLLLLVICEVQSNSSYRELRIKRHLINENEVSVNVEWLTDEQLSELGNLDNISQVNKICQFYESLVSAEERKAAANKIVTQCYDWLPEVTTDLEREELKRLRHDNHTACQERISIYISRLTEQRQSQLLKYWSFCEHVWNDTIKHRETSSQEQEDNSVEAIIPTSSNVTNVSNNETESFVDTPATREKRQLKGYQFASRKYSRYPRSHHDHHHNHHNQHHQYHQHHHFLDNLEHCFVEHLNWLNETQKEELRTMKDEKKNSAELREKVLEFYQETTGDVQQQAKEKLDSVCQDEFRTLVGKEKRNTIAELEKSNASVVQIIKQVEKILAETTNVDHNSTESNGIIAYCTRIYAIDNDILKSRTRRHNHQQHHSLEDYFNTYLRWLTEDQREELKALKQIGAGQKELQSKVLSFYDETSGDVRQNATNILKQGCTELFVSVFGKEKYDQVKLWKENGTPLMEIIARVDNFTAELNDDHKKEQAQEYGEYCKKLFQENTRRRRAITDYFSTHLNWLSDTQKNELKKLQDNGNSRKELQEKVKKYFEDTKGEERERAAELLRNGCIQLFKKLFGNEKFTELKHLKESNVPIEKMVAKIDEFSEQLTNSDDRAKIEEYGPYCRKLFDVKYYGKRIRKDLRYNGLRYRRSHHEHHGHEHHTLDDYFKTHLSWLTDAQREELKGLKAGGNGRKELQDKIQDYYLKSTGETRVTATQQLKGACAELFVSVFGKEKLAEIRKLKEEGATFGELTAKIDGFVANIKDEHKRAKANEYGPYCRRLYQEASNTRRRRGYRDHGRKQNSLEEYFQTHLNWLTEDQKEELRSLKAKGEDRTTLHEKVHIYFEQSSGDQRRAAYQQLKGGCIDIFVSVFGKEMLDEMKQLHESGKTIEEIFATIGTFITKVSDENTKRRMTDYQAFCKRVYSTGKTRRRRNHYAEDDIEKYFISHLNWLTEEQKLELKSLKVNENNPTVLQNKISEYYAKTDGETKKIATERLKSGCHELFMNVFGEEKLNQLKDLMTNDVSTEEITNKVEEFIASLTEVEKKAKIQQYGPHCKKLYSMVTKMNQNFL